MSRGRTHTVAARRTGAALLLALLVALPVLVAAADPAPLTARDGMVLEIIPLEHRLVDDVVPTLRALVAPGGTVTGMQSQLVVRTTPDNLAELRRVLAALDTKLRTLRITVRQDVEAHSSLREDELSARVRAGDVAARVGGPGRGPGASVGYGDGDSELTYRNFSTRSRDDTENTHFVHTVEGSPAFIAAGQSVPLPYASTVVTPFGASVQQSIDYREVGAGFYVTPRVAGERVNLEISPFADRLDRGGGGVIDAKGLSTVVSGRLGEWIALGGAAERFNDASTGILYSTRTDGSDVYDVWVKVEVLP